MNATLVPTRKVSWAALAGTIVTLAVYVLNGYVPFFVAKPISAELAATVITLVTTIVAYLVPPGATETTVVANGGVKTAKADPG